MNIIIIIIIIIYPPFNMLLGKFHPYPPECYPLISSQVDVFLKTLTFVIRVRNPRRIK
jgi:hypothetical protein